jgi:hypothetical protein
MFQRRSRPSEEPDWVLLCSAHARKTQTEYIKLRYQSTQRQATQEQLLLSRLRTIPGTMDFEHAAQRLKRDQAQIRGRTTGISVKAKREVELRKKQQQRLAAERQRQKRKQEFIEHYYKQCERKSCMFVSESRLGNGLTLFLSLSLRFLGSQKVVTG